MIDDSPRCRSIVSYPLYRLAVYLSPPPRYPKIHSPPKWPRQPLQITRLPCPVFPNIPLTVNFQFRNYRHRYRGPVNFQPRKRLSPPIFTSLYELRFNTRRYYARSVCVYIYMESWWEEYKKKVTTSIMGVHRMGEKTCGGRERERERNGGVKILKRVS